MISLSSSHTVDSFATLRRLFERQFAFDKTQNLTYMELTKIKQGKDEDLKDFMDRYNQTAR